jgi:hypothetical protein
VCFEHVVNVDRIQTVRIFDVVALRRALDLSASISETRLHLRQEVKGVCQNVTVQSLSPALW